MKKTNVTKPEASNVEPNVTGLGALEAEVMLLLWDRQRPATAMEIGEEALYKYRARGEEPISFATITTTLRRLTEKGLVSSRKLDTRTPIYAPIIGREAMAAHLLDCAMQMLFELPFRALLNAVADDTPELAGLDVRKLQEGLRESAEGS